MEGVHVPTWIESKMELLLNKYIGPDWLGDHDSAVIWELIDDIPEQELWHVHYRLKIKLINFIRERARQRWVRDRVNHTNIVAEGTLLDPSVLTIGFARRFATYKRTDLIFYDLQRLKTILNNRWRPLQIIFTGKAHPADDPGKRILQRVFNFAHDPDLGGRIAFVEDDDEQLAQYMTHGVDVWLNNPMPPLEACGTSGMKASLNGVPHLSILDGWWIEGFNGKNGWAFGGSGDDGIPHDWVKVMKEAIKNTAPVFSSRRMVKEYAKKFYHDALKAARRKDSE